MSWPIALGAVIIFIVVAVLLWRFWWIWPKQQADRYSQKISDPKSLADIEDDYRKTVSQLLGGAAVLIGAGFAVYQFLNQQRAATEQTRISNEQIRTTRDQLISQQVSKGFEQLGSDKLVMRLGGIYALEGVMNTSDQYHRPVLEALCAFVREATKALAAHTQPIRNKSRQPPADAKPAPETPIPAADVQAALTVIGRRANKTDHPDLRYVSVPAARLFKAALNGAFMPGANLSEAFMPSVDLSGATLINANLSQATAALANLSGADLDGVNLSRSTLSGANLTKAVMVKANLSGTFLPGANLSGAIMRGVDLRGANMPGVNLSGADLSGAKGISQDQLNKTCGDANTKLPPGLTIKSCPVSAPK